MKYTKYIVAKIEYDTEETWKETEKDINDIIEMLTNLKRRATIIEIDGVDTKQGVDSHVNDGQDK
jgi:hypothetical protein|tara:strand:- start:5233 stop:5427 length:195 start_codon:yes stop_codon:yes gene_type:complete